MSDPKPNAFREAATKARERANAYQTKRGEAEKAQRTATKGASAEKNPEVAGTEAVKFFTDANGRVIPITPASGGDRVIKTGPSLYRDPKDGTPYKIDPLHPSGLRNAWDDAPVTSKDGKLVQKITGVGTRTLGEDPKAQEAAKAKEAKAAEKEAKSTADASAKAEADELKRQQKVGRVGIGASKRLVTDTDATFASLTKQAREQYGLAKGDLDYDKTQLRRIEKELEEIQDVEKQPILEEQKKELEALLPAKQKRVAELDAEVHRAALRQEEWKSQGRIAARQAIGAEEDKLKLMTNTGRREAIPQPVAPKAGNEGFQPIADGGAPMLPPGMKMLPNGSKAMDALAEFDALAPQLHRVQVDRSDQVNRDASLFPVRPALPSAERAAQMSRQTAREVGKADLYQPEGFEIGKDEIKANGQTVARVTRDADGLPALEMQRGAPSPSLASGNPYDGAPEYADIDPEYAAKLKGSGDDKAIADEWRARRWSPDIVGGLINRWQSSNDAERGEILAEIQPGLNEQVGKWMADPTQPMPRLNTRALWQSGQISAQEGRQLERIFYGEAPGPGEPLQAWNAFKAGDSPEAKAIRAEESLGGNVRKYNAAIDAAASKFIGDYATRHGSRIDFDPTKFSEFADSIAKDTKGYYGRLADTLDRAAQSGVGSSIGALYSLAIRAPATLFKAVGSLVGGEKLAGDTDASKAADNKGELAMSWNELDLIHAQTGESAKGMWNFIRDRATLDVTALWSGVEGKKLNKSLGELTKLAASEELTPTQRTKLGAEIKQTALALTGTDPEAGDYYDIDNPDSPAGQALNAYLATRDPVYKDAMKHALTSTPRGRYLEQAAAAYASANGAISDTETFGRLRSGFRGAQVAPVQEQAVEALSAGVQGAASKALMSAKTGAQTAIASGKALTWANRAALKAEQLGDWFSKVGMVEGAVMRNTAVQGLKTAGVSFVSEGMEGAITSMGTGATIGDVIDGFVQEGLGALGMGPVMATVGMGADAVAKGAAYAKDAAAVRGFVTNWNKENPTDPMTVEDWKQARAYLPPTAKGTVEEIKAALETIAQGKAVVAQVEQGPATPEAVAQVQAATQQAQAAVEVLTTAATTQQAKVAEAKNVMQEVNGIADPALREFADAAVKAVRGVPLTETEAEALERAVAGVEPGPVAPPPVMVDAKGQPVKDAPVEPMPGIPLAKRQADGTYLITQTGLDALNEAMPRTGPMIFPPDERSQITAPVETVNPGQNSEAAEATAPQSIGQDAANVMPPTAGGVGQPMSDPQQQAPQEPAPAAQSFTVPITITAKTGGTRIMNIPVRAETAEQAAQMAMQKPQVRAMVKGGATAQVGDIGQPMASQPQASPTPEQAVIKESLTTQPLEPTAPPETEAEVPEQAARAREQVRPFARMLMEAATAFGYKIVDTGLPFGFTDRYNKFHSFGTQIIDKAFPGSEIGQWIDNVNNSGLSEVIQANMSAPWFHRVWFGHDPLASVGAVIDKFGVAALPEYAGQLLKDSLTKSGIPLPGVQWLVHAGVVSDKVGTEWLSLNIGEALSSGLALIGTYRLYKKAKNGTEIAAGWAAVGIAFKMVGGVLSANPVLILSGIADAVIVVAARKGTIKAGLQKARELSKNDPATPTPQPSRRTDGPEPTAGQPTGQTVGESQPGPATQGPAPTGAQTAQQPSSGGRNSNAGTGGSGPTAQTTGPESPRTGAGNLQGQGVTSPNERQPNTTTEAAGQPTRSPSQERNAEPTPDQETGGGRNAPAGVSRWEQAVESALEQFKGKPNASARALTSLAILRRALAARKTAFDDIQIVSGLEGSGIQTEGTDAGDDGRFTRVILKVDPATWVAQNLRMEGDVIVQIVGHEVIHAMQLREFTTDEMRDFWLALPAEVQADAYQSYFAAGIEDGRMDAEPREWSEDMAVVMGFEAQRMLFEDRLFGQKITEAAMADPSLKKRIVDMFKRLIDRLRNLVANDPAMKALVDWHTARAIEGLMRLGVQVPGHRPPSSPMGLEMKNTGQRIAALREYVRRQDPNQPKWYAITDNGVVLSVDARLFKEPWEARRRMAEEARTMGKWLAWDAGIVGSASVPDPLGQFPASVPYAERLFLPDDVTELVRSLDWGYDVEANPDEHWFREDDGAGVAFVPPPPPPEQRAPRVRTPLPVAPLIEGPVQGPLQDTLMELPARARTLEGMREAVRARMDEIQAEQLDLETRGLVLRESDRFELLDRAAKRFENLLAKIEARLMPSWERTNKESVPALEEQNRQISTPEGPKPSPKAERVKKVKAKAREKAGLPAAVETMDAPPLKLKTMTDDELAAKMAQYEADIAPERAEIKTLQEQVNRAKKAFGSTPQEARIASILKRHNSLYRDQYEPYQQEISRRSAEAMNRRNERDKQETEAAFKRLETSDSEPLYPVADSNRVAFKWWQGVGQSKQPTQWQRRLMDATAARMDAGTFYTEQLIQEVFDSFKDQLPEGVDHREKVSGGNNFGFQIYLAKDAVDKERAIATQTKVAEYLKPGLELKKVTFGQHTFSTFTVNSIEGNEVKGTGKKRGSSQTWDVTTNPAGLAEYIKGLPDFRTPAEKAKAQILSGESNNPTPGDQTEGGAVSEVGTSAEPTGTRSFAPAAEVDIVPQGEVLPSAESWASTLEQATNLTVQEFAEMAKTGKIHQATGAGAEQIFGTMKSPLSIGFTSGYPLADIAHFYAKRRTAMNQTVAELLEYTDDPADNPAILTAFDEFAADADREQAAQVETVLTREAVRAAASVVNTEPTEAQKLAGNYQKGHLRLHGLDISIETVAGTARSGTDRDGKKWRVVLPHHYGDIKRTKASDKDNIDVFIGPKPELQTVFIVDQVKQGNGHFDEHKIMLGFETIDEARAGYEGSFSEGWKVGPMFETSLDDLKAWLAGGDLSRKAAEQFEKVEPVSIDTAPPEATPEPTTTPESAPVSTVEKVKAKERAKKSKKPTWIDKLEAYFQPGVIVKGYGGFDRVISFTRDGGPLGQWGVTVIRVTKDGQPVPGERERSHATQPGEKELDAAWAKKQAADETAKASAPTPTTPEQVETAPEATEAPAPATAVEKAKAKARAKVAGSAPAGGLTDFGQKLGGARKDRVPTINAELTDSDIAGKTLSEIWPKSEIDSIEEIDAAAFATALRDEIPTKPQRGYKLNGWVAKVKLIKGLMRDAATMGVPALLERMKTTSSVLSPLVDKIVMLQVLPRDQWGRVGKVRNYPDAYRFDGMAKVPSPWAEAEVDGRRVNAKNLEELTAAVTERLGDGKPVAKMEFEIRGRSGNYKINKKGDPLYRPLKTFTEDKPDAAFEYRKNNYADLVAEWEKVKERDNVKETDLRTDENRPRRAKDYRQGKDVTPEDFQDAFGFRGVEFGNWVSQGKNAKERQGMINEAYDAFHDLAGILNVPTRALSLGGEMGLGFGSRGHGWASAHYEPGNIVINLTKTRGAGTLAHEFFHAIDHYFGRARGESIRDRHGVYITNEPETRYVNSKTGQSMSVKRWNEMSETRPSFFNKDDWKIKEGVRPEVEESFAALVKALDASPMTERSRLNDKGKSGYWGSTIERAARSFENYIIHKMQLEGYHNDYLANVVPVESFVRDAKRYPYLLENEIEPVAKAFDDVFATIKTKKENGKVVLYAPEAVRLPERLIGAGERLAKWAREDVDDEIRALFFTNPITGERDTFADVAADFQRISDADAVEYVQWLREIPDLSPAARDVVEDIAWSARVPRDGIALGAPEAVKPLTRESVFAHRLATAKADIAADMANGTIPAGVRSFAKLHDYVDANEYVNDAERPDRQIGPLGKQLGWGVQEYVNFTGELIGALDKWLKGGKKDGLSLGAPESIEAGQSQENRDTTASMASTDGAAQSNEPSPGGLSEANARNPMTIYRAGDADEIGVKPWASFTPHLRTAEAYTDNPGFGGDTVRELRVDAGNVLDLTTGNKFRKLAEALGFEGDEAIDKADDWHTSGWNYPWEESSKVKRALEESEFDAVQYTDDFPEGATTIIFTREPQSLTDPRAQSGTILRAPQPIRPSKPAADHLNAIRREAEKQRTAMAAPATPQRGPINRNDVIADGMMLIQDQFYGRIDRLDAILPGTRDLIQKNRLDIGFTKAAVASMMDQTMKRIQKSFGTPKFWSSRKKRLNTFMSELIPAAARLEAVDMTPDGQFVFKEFERPVSFLSDDDLAARDLSEGDEVPHGDGTMLTVGPRIPERGGRVLTETMTPETQAEIYADFVHAFPEGAWVLDEFISPGGEGSREIGPGGTETPTFNRASLLNYMNEEWPDELKRLFTAQPMPPVMMTEGWTPDIAAQRTAGHMIGALLRNFVAAVRRTRTGERIESGDIKNLLEGFEFAAFEAVMEKQRLETRRRLLNLAAKPATPPAAGAMREWLRGQTPMDDVIQGIVRHWVSARGLSRSLVPTKGEDLTDDQKALIIRLTGDVGRFWNQNYAVPRRIYQEMIALDARGQINNKLLRVIDWFLSRYITGLLVNIGTVVVNYASNKVMRGYATANRLAFAVSSLAHGDWAAAKLGALEFGHLLRGSITDRLPGMRQTMRNAVPDEIYDDSSTFAREGIQVHSKVWENLKDFNPGAAFLQAVNYSSIDQREKVRFTHALLRATADMEADKAGLKRFTKARSEFIRDWLENSRTKHPKEFQRAFQMTHDFLLDMAGNAPAIIDPSQSSSELGAIFKKGTFMFWRYIGAIYGFGAKQSLGSAVALVNRRLPAEKRAQAAANLLTSAAVVVFGALLTGDEGDEDEDPLIGRTFDDAGKKLSGAVQTGDRINASKVYRRARKYLQGWGVPISDDGTVPEGTEEMDVWVKASKLPIYSAAIFMGHLANRDTIAALGAFKGFKDDITKYGPFVDLNPFVYDIKEMNEGKPYTVVATDALFDILTSPILPSRVRQAAVTYADPNWRLLKPEPAINYVPGPMEALKANIPWWSLQLPINADYRDVLNAPFDAGDWKSQQLSAIKGNKDLTPMQRAKLIVEVNQRMPVLKALERRQLDILKAVGVDPKFLDRKKKTGVPWPEYFDQLLAKGVGAESIKAGEETIMHRKGPLKGTETTHSRIMYPEPDRVGVKTAQDFALGDATGINVKKVKRGGLFAELAARRRPPEKK